MTLIIVKNKEVLAMTDLMLYALRYIYERDTMKANEVRLMMDSVVNWQKHLQLREEFGLTAIEQEYLHTLQDVAKLLRADEEGKFEARKKNFKYHGIDYRKFHRLPGAVTEEDKAKAARMKAEYDRKNPEQEDTGNSNRLIIPDAAIDYIKERRRS